MTLCLILTIMSLHTRAVDEERRKNVGNLLNRTKYQINRNFIEVLPAKVVRYAKPYIEIDGVKFDDLKLSKDKFDQYKDSDVEITSEKLNDYFKNNDNIEKITLFDSRNNKFIYQLKINKNESNNIAIFIINDNKYYI